MHAPYPGCVCPRSPRIPDDVKALWARPLEKMGFVPNVLKILALRPAHLPGWWAYYDSLMRGPSNLSKAQREMIAVVVSATNRCLLNDRPQRRVAAADRRPDLRGSSADELPDRVA